MTSMPLSLIAASLLIAAISVGAYLVYVGLRRHKRMPQLGLTHAGLAMAGFIALALQILEGPPARLNNLAAFFLALALIGGAMVFLLHEKGRPPSMPVVIIHAIMGVIGLSLLLIGL
jgi:hypothetical protein